MKLGIIPAMISPYVIAAMGERMARRYMLTGEEFDAAEAYRIGFCTTSSRTTSSNARVGTLLAHLYSQRAQGDRRREAADRRVAHMRRSTSAAIEDTSRRIAEIRATPKAQEGLSAFLEKRKPAWIAPPASQQAREKAREIAMSVPTTSEDRRSRSARRLAERGAAGLRPQSRSS